MSLTCEEKSNVKHKLKIWDIEYVKNKLGDELCDSLLVKHALLGCGVTTKVYTVGKVTELKKSNDNMECRRLEKVLLSSGQSKQDILVAAEKLVFIVTGSNVEKTLDELRFSKCNKIT